MKKKYKTPPEGKCKKTSIGGQALLEGIMMRGPEKTSVVVRLEDGSMDTDFIDVKPLKKKCPVLAWPIIRGVAGMIQSFAVGYKALMISADKIGLDDESEEPGKFEKWVMKHFGDKLIGVITGIASVIGVAVALLLFMWLPIKVFNLFNTAVTPGVSISLSAVPDGVAGSLDAFKGLFEGILKIIIFLAYISLTSLMKDIHRTFEYHGAEHKTIFCYEAGEELTPENAREYSRFHPRCGTSFLVLMLVISILVSSLVLYIFPSLKTITWLWVAVKILLVPLICGLGYELIRVCGRHNNIVTRIIAAPGLWVQRLTTKEPDDSMLEVAIKALKEVIPENSEDDEWGKS